MSKQKNKASFKFSLSLSVLITITVILTLLIFSWVQEADATTIGISLSRSCQISSTCPTYEDLAVYDNTNQYYSGFLNYSYNGVFERQPSPYQNHWEFYRYSHQIWIVVDSQGEWMPHLSKHIILEPSEFVFFDVGDFKVEPEI